MALLGTHNIGYRVPADSKLHQIQFAAYFVFEETNYNIIKHFGTDTWEVYVGHVFSQMLANAKIREEAVQTQVILKDLKVTSFKKGLFQWSTHKFKTEFKFEVLQNNSIRTEGKVTGFGKGNGREFGEGVYVPVFGNSKFDMGLEIALHRSLEMCLLKLREYLSDYVQ